MDNTNLNTAMNVIENYGGYSENSLIDAFVIIDSNDRHSNTLWPKINVDNIMSTVREKTNSLSTFLSNVSTSINNINDSIDAKPRSRRYRAPPRKCYRCGRTTHWVNNCHETTYMNGRILT